MDINLKNRKVVITGVSEGIGKSLAMAFGEAGAKLPDLHAIVNDLGHRK